MYKSVSAFAPIANPIQCPWGQKAFKGYFGEEAVDKWKEHDATELVKKYKGPLDVLIDVVCRGSTSLACYPLTASVAGNERQLLQARAVTARELCGCSERGR